MSRCLSGDIQQNTHNLMAKVMVSLNFLCFFSFHVYAFGFVVIEPVLFRHDLVESNSLLILISFLIFAFCPFCFAWNYLMFPSFCNYPTNGESQLLAGHILGISLESHLGLPALRKIRSDPAQVSMSPGGAMKSQRSSKIG